MRILIAEDEGLAARRLERIVAEILGPKVESLTVKESLQDAEEFLFEKPIDLLLLDLNLSGEDGYGLLRLAASGSFQTIVVSANTDRALEAFQYGVLDFVPKPYEPERLRAALSRMEQGGAARPAAKYLSVRKHGKVELIPVDEVLYLAGAGDYVEVHLAGGRMELHTKTLEALGAVLPPHFERIHKSYVADLRAMRRIVLQGAGKYAMEMKGGALLPISRTKYRELKDRT
jgi:two-component system, LytTR family, response regulator LytT